MVATKALLLSFAGILGLAATVEAASCRNPRIRKEWYVNLNHMELVIG